MPSALKSFPTAGVSSSETVVYTATASPAVTATMIGILVCNNNDGGAQRCTLRLKRGANFYNIGKAIPIPLSDTFVPSGFEGKLVLMPGDELRVSVDTGTVDVIASMLEQTP